MHEAWSGFAALVLVVGTSAPANAQTGAAVVDLTAWRVTRGHVGGDTWVQIDDVGLEVV